MPAESKGLNVEDPTQEEIRKRRAEIHRDRGELADAKWILEQHEADYSRVFPEDEDDPRFRSLYEIGLPPRIAGPLERRSVYLAGDLCGYTEERLRLFREFGDRSIEIIKEALASIGLSLRESRPGDVVPPLPDRIEFDIPKKSSHRLTEEQEERIFELIAQGSSQREIARMLGIQRWTVWNRLRLFKAAVTALFRDGATEHQIQKKVGRDRWKVWQMVRIWDGKRNVVKSRA